MPANVLTLRPADVQLDTMIGCNFSGRALSLQAAMHHWEADIVGLLAALLDANGRVGSIPSPAVEVIDPQEEDAGGELLHDFLGKSDLVAANTFDGTRTTHRGGNQGPGGTDRLCGLPAALASPCCYVRGRPTSLQPSQTRRTTDLFFAKLALREEREKTDEREADRGRRTFDRARLKHDGVSRAFPSAVGVCPTNSS